MKILPLAFAAALPLLAGCATYPSAPTLALVTVNKGPVALGTGKTAYRKTGEATSYGISILYYFSIAWGDSSIEKAARKGGIQEIGIVDSENVNILGLFSIRTTVVSGN